MAAHSTLGASSSKRWMECPGSIALSEGMPNESSEYAVEGTCAHYLGEYCLAYEKNADDFIGKWITYTEFANGSKNCAFHDAEVPAEKTDQYKLFCFEVDETMVDAVQLYLDTVRADCDTEDKELSYETRFDLSHIHPGMFGTNDAAVYDPIAKKLTVYDFKYGQGVPVEVEENSQLMYYAVGALTGKHNRPIADVEIVVIQPRCRHVDGPVRRWRVTPLYLLEWIGDLVEAAKKTESPSAGFNPGEWCRFCPAAAICGSLKDKITEIAQLEFARDGSVLMADPKNYDKEQLLEALKFSDMAKHWAASVNAFAHHEAEAGRCPEGYKLVNKEGHRKHHSEERTIQALEERGISQEEITKPGKLMSPAEIEKVAKKKGVKPKELEELWHKPKIGSTLVPVDDKREATKPTVEQEFGAQSLF